MNQLPTSGSDSLPPKEYGFGFGDTELEKDKSPADTWYPPFERPFSSQSKSTSLHFP